MSAGAEKGKSSSSFPEGLRVLVIDADETSLQELSQMNQSCGYLVTTASRADDALFILQKSGNNKFDVVISDINVPDMDGFKLIEIISVDMDIPLVMVSGNDDNDIIMRGFSSGASDYLVKPIQRDDIKFIWKHVVRKQKQEGNLKMQKQSNSREKSELKSNNASSEDKENITVGSSKSDESTKEDGGKCKDEISLKKPRMVWTTELHQQFIDIVNHIGVEHAVPKRILEMMNVGGLTRENVASHLQKYRLNRQKLEKSIERKAQMQSQAINRGLNSHMYSYNNQNQAINIAQNNQLQSMGKRRLDSTYTDYVPPLSQVPMGDYGATRSQLGVMQIRDHVNQPSPLDHQLSSFHRSSRSSSLLMQRPYKIQKLNNNGETNHEVFNNDAIWNSPIIVPPTIVDVSTGLYTEICEQESPLLQNGGNRFYGGGGNIIDDGRYSFPESTYFVQHVDQEDAQAYSELDGNFVGYHTENNSA